jgi:hypothetical protein
VQSVHWKDVGAHHYDLRIQPLRFLNCPNFISSFAAQRAKLDTTESE